MRWILDNVQYELWIVKSYGRKMGYYSNRTRMGEVFMPFHKYMHWIYPTDDHEANMADITDILIELYPDREWD